ncbi:MAG: NAD(P)-dependent oxidoreductase [Rhodocyclaceae bacterium]|nr:NAD(P)-dependent oxidoreductase [Rhodocyclaceae bacterium]MDZ4214823.1 NAD(P)-dependent oxidoreductase [Rhodocyclaceae bacterium]
MGLTVLTGASGFLGRNLLSSNWARCSRVRALTRMPRSFGENDCGVEWVVGDLTDHTVWNRLIEPGCTLINLAYPKEMDLAAAIAATRAMVAACSETKIARLVHCSSISVFGRTASDVNTELTPCTPIDNYGRQKLAIESALYDSVDGRFELAVLRPSVIFGSGGQALRSLCDSLVGGTRVVNYCRSSLFGRRNMHLVPVETVVGALRFLCETRRVLDGDIFVVSEDDDPLNNFQDVERILMEGLRLPNYSIPRIPIPEKVLKGLLRLRGRSDISPTCKYRCEKLARWEFVRPISFEVALRQFAASLYRSSESGASS